MKIATALNPQTPAILVCQRARRSSTRRRTTCNRCRKPLHTIHRSLTIVEAHKVRKSRNVDFFQRFCHWSVYFSLQGQNKLTNDALLHLHNRHRDFLCDKIVEKSQQFSIYELDELRLSSNSCGWCATVFYIDCM